MKIMQVTKKYPNALGGDSNVVYSLKKMQIKDEQEVVVLTSNCDEIKNSKYIYKVGIRDTPSGLDNITLKRIISLLMLFYASFKIIKSEQPDIIHTHSIDMAFFISFAARRYKIPIVHTFHILTFYDKNQSFIKRKTELFLTRKAKLDSITTPNIDYTQKLQSVGLTQTVTVPNGLDTNYWRKQQPSIKKEEFTFVSVGRLEQQKGFEYLVKAVGILQHTNKTKKFKVIIAGEGSLRDSLKALASSLDVSELISFVGRKSQKQLLKIYSESDAMIVTSLYEAGQISLLEAWAMELPTISTPVGILSSSSEGVLLINERDEQSAAEAMSLVLTDPSKKRKLIYDGNIQIQKYSLNNFYNLIKKQYERALSTSIIQASAYYPPHLGGQENVVYDLTRYLKDKNWRVEVVTSALGWAPGFKDLKEVTIRRLRGLEFGHTPILPGAFFYLLRRAKRPKTIIHLHIGQAFLPEIVWLVSKIRNIPYIAELHIDSKISSKVGYLLPLYKKIFLKRVINHASSVLVLSSDARDVVRSFYGYKGEIKVVSNGVDEDYFNVLRAKSINKDTLSLLFVGRLSKQKNLPMLIEALSLINFNVSLDIIGDGESRNEVEEIIKNKKLKNVFMHGRLGRSEVLDFYKTKDALILPSLYEAQPLVILEAMAAKIPIIATKATGLTELLSGVGLTSSLTKESLASKLEEFYKLSQEEKDVLTDNGYRKALKFKWSRQIEQYEDIYKEIVL